MEGCWELFTSAVGTEVLNTHTPFRDVRGRVSGPRGGVNVRTPVTGKETETQGRLVLVSGQSDESRGDTKDTTRVRHVPLLKIQGPLFTHLPLSPERP